VNDLTFGELDRDGALGEALEKVTVDSRADFLRKTLIGSAALLAALSLPERAGAASRNDIDILNYALTLEYLQAAFYTETERAGAVRGKAKEAARLVGAVERAHVKAFRKALGSAAVKRPSFNFRGVTESQTPFLKTAVAFEDLAVAAYKGQAPLIQSKAILAVAISIHSVEARHAAWMRYLFGIVPSDRPFDLPAPKPKVLRTVASTGFITSKAKTSRKQKPRFTG
jgi:Ferritin-like domain